MDQPYYEPASGEDDDGGGGGGRIFPEHPSPILHAPRDNISRKGNPSLRLLTPLPVVGGGAALEINMELIPEFWKSLISSFKNF